MPNQKLIEHIRRGLRESQDPERALKMQAYMKSSMPYLGVPMPVVRKFTTTAARSFPFSGEASLLNTATVLWREAEFREERYVAMALTGLKATRANLIFLPLYCEMVSTGAWWDHVDEVAHRIKDLLQAHPSTMKPLILTWSEDEDFWFRRLSIISQLQAKAGTDVELLTQVIEPNMPDSEFFIRKAIGWALREYAKTDPEWVKEFVAVRETQLSPLSRREALKHLS
ncbi:3-methyladenine DNA glycosylase AlkD [Psychromicrobium silvestre]|uniref:3-methyladenine DNA glycosylase AlkD n=1 Tax=Psychromicrobium silvestre TaxID=1645614 RepID=A0A7Y9S6E0_9MICC|nr:DNA alkylation repair protein [Psychromicrobium silvestre]NYE94551.1 3-methyladenine DNA glycosylase AlkD [Psychromicrobium silvestre]